MGAADIDHDAVLVEPLGEERGAHHEGRAVQFLRRPEHRAAERMRDHDLVGDFNGEHGTPPFDRASRIADQRAARVARRPPAAPAAAPAGRRNRPAARAAHRAQDRRAARAPPPAAARYVQRGRCDGATLPTWLATSRSRRLWNAPPSGAATSPAPYQLNSTTVASSPASAARCARPAALALAWNTRSQSRGASSGGAKPRAERARQRGTRRRDIDHRHLGAGHPRAQPRDQQPDHAAADDRDAVRRSGRAVPDRIERGLHIGGEHGALRRHAVRHRTAAAVAGTTNSL